MRPGLPASPRSAWPIMVLCLVIIGAILAALFTHTSSIGTLAAQSSPPLPPTFVPSPIGGPPAPPTATPTATIAAATPAGSPTPSSSSPLFSLDAARVSKVNDPGDMRGLLSVTRGSKTWLMIYYTIKSLPKKMRRQATYSVLYRGKTVFKAIFNDSLKRTEVGRFSKYTQFNVPRSLPYGQYVYLSTLTIGSHRQSKSWRFSVAKQEREAAS